MQECLRVLAAGGLCPRLQARPVSLAAVSAAAGRGGRHGGRGGTRPRHRAAAVGGAARDRGQHGEGYIYIFYITIYLYIYISVYLGEGGPGNGEAGQQPAAGRGQAAQVAEHKPEERGEPTLTITIVSKL